MFVNEAGHVVDAVVHDYVKAFFRRVVRGYFGRGEGFGHFARRAKGRRGDAGRLERVD